MPRERDEVDDYVDGLTVPEKYRETPTEEFAAITTPTKPKTNWRAIAAVGLFVGGLFTGICGAGTVYSSDSSSAPPSPPTVTVTVTREPTQPPLPASCRRALELMSRVMDDVSAIGNAATQQLDIAHDARQAMFSKDWKALDDAMNRQKALNDRLSEASVDSLGSFPELREAMKKCEQDAS